MAEDLQQYHIGVAVGTYVPFNNETVGTVYPYRCIWRECWDPSVGAAFIGLEEYYEVIVVGVGATAPAGWVPCYRCMTCHKKFYRNGLFFRESALLRGEPDRPLTPF